MPLLPWLRLIPGTREKLRSLLLYHVIAGGLLVADLRNGDLKTMNGGKVKVDAGVDRNPYQAAAIGIGCGALIGFLVARQIACHHG